MEENPYTGAMLSVVSSLAKLTALGGDFRHSRLTFQEYFERLGADPAKWGIPFSALLGAVQAQIAMGTPAIGGKDSMSGTFEQLHVPPTLVSFAVTTEKIRNMTSQEFKNPGAAASFVQDARQRRRHSGFCGPEGNVCVYSRADRKGSGAFCEGGRLRRNCGSRQLYVLRKQIQVPL